MLCVFLFSTAVVQFGFVIPCSANMPNAHCTTRRPFGLVIAGSRLTMSTGDQQISQPSFKSADGLTGEVTSACQLLVVTMMYCMALGKK